MKVARRGFFQMLSVAPAGAVLAAKLEASGATAQEFEPPTPGTFFTLTLPTHQPTKVIEHIKAIWDKAFVSRNQEPPTLLVLQPGLVLEQVRYPVKVYKQEPAGTGRYTMEQSLASFDKASVNRAADELLRRHKSSR